MITSSVFVVALSCTDEDPQDQLEKIISVNSNLQASMNEYRNLLGTDNGNKVGSQGSGRREINWDGVPDAFSAPNAYPSDFFLGVADNNRARGALFNAPGGQLTVSAGSANSTNTAVSFGHINPQYSRIFPAFSGDKLFSPVGTNVVDLTFHIPGSTTKAAVRGFGAVYVDVDKVENTAFEYFDINEESLGSYKTLTQNEGHVFLGVLFKKAIVHRVRITYGNSKLGPDDGGNVDVSVMDDFIYGEPVLPE